MAPLTRSIHYELPELPLVAPVKGKNITTASYPIALSHPQIPRLLRFKDASKRCYSCDGAGAELSCSECGGMVLYCNTQCQEQDWPHHKDVCAHLKENLLKCKIKENEADRMKYVAEIINKVFTPDYKFPDYKCVPNLEVSVKNTVSFGSLHDVLSQSDLTQREFQSGVYKCTSVTPYEHCAPLTIYHHDSVDPGKIVKQCILMSRDFNDHSNEVNQITQPDWCIWEDSDNEYIPSESESDTSDSELVAQHKVLGDFVDKVYSEDLFESDAEDNDYDPEESESDSSFSEDISDNEVEYIVAESRKVTKDINQKRNVLVNEIDESEDSESDGESNELLDSVGLYKEFKINLFTPEHSYGSDSEASDYLPFDESESEDDVSDFEVSEDEVEDILEEGKDFRDVEGDMYEGFIDAVFENHDLEQSVEDEDYIPKDNYSSSSSEDEEISDSEINNLLEDGKDCTSDINGKRISRQTRFSSSESSDDSEVSTEDERYEDFQIVLQDQLVLSDSDSVEYQKEMSESETSSDSSESSDYEMEISDAENTSLVNEVKECLLEVSGRKRRLPSVEDTDSEEYSEESDEYEISSDEELFNKFICGDCRKHNAEQAGIEIESSDDEFMLSDDSEDSQLECSTDSEDYQTSDSSEADSSEEEMEISDSEVQKVIDDLELSSEGELYEDFKSTVIKPRTPKPKTKETERKPAYQDNRDFIYFINSSNSSYLKNILDNGKFQETGVISESLTISNGNEPSGMAVAIRGADWRSAHVFEDSSSSKCFALVVATDMGPLSNFNEDWERNFPNLNWTSVSETQLVFNMKDFQL